MPNDITEDLLDKFFIALADLDDLDSVFEYEDDFFSEEEMLETAKEIMQGRVTRAREELTALRSSLITERNDLKKQLDALLNHHNRMCTCGAIF